MTIYVGGKPLCKRKGCRKFAPKANAFCLLHKQCEKDAREFSHIMGMS